MKEETIRKEAIEAGFEDAKIVLYEGKRVLVLFAPYASRAVREKGRIGVSSYYIVSNQAYLNAGLLAEKLSGMGMPSARTTELPTKQIALLTGGFLGKNGFYYHDVFGSMVHMQTILMESDTEKKGNGSLAAALACTKKEGKDEGCADCGCCRDVCPTGAIGDAGVDYSKCVRNYLEMPVLPDEIKPFIYQLFGCEKCQTACPINRAGEKQNVTVDLIASIKGETILALQELAGKNIARLVRVVNQSVVYAANEGYREALPAVQEIAADVRFADACRYYLRKIGEKDCTCLPDMIL